MDGSRSGPAGRFAFTLEVKDLMDLLVFDLDGTLVNSTLDLANSVNAARVYMGMEPLPVPTVASYVGNGVSVLIRKAMGPEADGETIDLAQTYFLSWYREHILDNTLPYPGVIEGLDEAHKAGHKMAVLTNKPERFSKALLAGLGMDKYFFRIYGGNTFPDKKPNPFGLRKLMQEAGAQPETTWMIGDSSVDIQTARNAGVRCVGVTYGIKPESLETDPPDVLLDSLTGLLPALKQ
jgi:phosphoglycolate phosphatase